MHSGFHLGLPILVFSNGADFKTWLEANALLASGLYWLIRFTPRKSRSKWSSKNRDRAIKLIAASRIRPSGRNECVP